MEYDAQGHVVVKDRTYPKAMHKAGATVMATSPEHEKQLTGQGYSAKIWDKDLHGVKADKGAA